MTTGAVLMVLFWTYIMEVLTGRAKALSYIMEVLTGRREVLAKAFSVEKIRGKHAEGCFSLAAIGAMERTCMRKEGRIDD